MLWLWLKALHIVVVVTWFAGLFYIVRLFVYHAEAKESGEASATELARQYRLMERRLWYGITWPSMVVTVFTGSWLALGLYGIQVPGWLLAKLGLVSGLIAYHFICHSLFLDFQQDRRGWSSFRLKLWNEAATFFLVAIVFLVVLKTAFNLVWGVASLALFAGLLVAAVFVYRNKRKNAGH